MDEGPPQSANPATLSASSRGIESMLTVVNGTNSAERASPWKNCGQKMSQ